MSVPPAAASAGAPADAVAGADVDPSRSHDVVSAQVAAAKDVADLIAEAVLAVPGVADLHGGPSGTVATYLPGRRVTGVAVRTVGSCAPGGADQESVEVAVVATAEQGLRTDLQALAAKVRGAVTLLTSAPVRVTIADLVRPTA